MFRSVAAAGIMCGICTPLGLLTSPLFAADGADLAGGPVDRVAAIHQFKAEHPRNEFTFMGNRIERVYGPAFSMGETAKQSADQFVAAHSALWGLGAADLIPVGPFDDGRHLQPILYDRATGQYKLTGVYYTQIRDGVPVYRSGLILVVRNEPGYPLVLASSSARDIGNFAVPALAAANVNANAGFAAV